MFKSFPKNQLKRRSFFRLIGSTALSLLLPSALAQKKSVKKSKNTIWTEKLEKIIKFPLFSALFSRRSRRFGWGMEIKNGPLKFKSTLPPIPIDEFETAVILSAGLGVSGWHNGIPHSEAQDGLCNYSVRYTGRTLPSAAGIGNTDLFYTDDNGTYFVSTRDADGDKPWQEESISEPEKIIQEVKRSTIKLSEERVQIPRTGRHFSAHNLWNGNTDGSTLFIPVANISEQVLAFLFIVVGSGFTVYDDLKTQTAGDLNDFIKSGLIDEKKKYPLSYLEQYILSTSSVEMGTMGHNMALSLQPLGLGGWFYSGINPFSIMGYSAKKGIPGLGFEFEKKEEWGVPNPLGIKGVYESYSPPFCADMREAVERVIFKKFGPKGTYRKNSGPFSERATILSASEPSTEVTECVVKIAEYIYNSYGKFPGTVPSIFIRFYVQAHRLETAFYDRYFKENSYLSTHLENVNQAKKIHSL